MSKETKKKGERIVSAPLKISEIKSIALLLDQPDRTELSSVLCHDA
jgi:hypothetical protein